MKYLLLTIALIATTAVGGDLLAKATVDAGRSEVASRAHRTVTGRIEVATITLGNAAPMTLPALQLALAHEAAARDAGLVAPDHTAR